MEFDWQIEVVGVVATVRSLFSPFKNWQNVFESGGMLCHGVEGGRWAVTRYCGYGKRAVCEQIERKGGGILMGSGLTNLCSSDHQIASSAWLPSYAVIT